MFNSTRIQRLNAVLWTPWICNNLGCNPCKGVVVQVLQTGVGGGAAAGCGDGGSGGDEGGGGGVIMQRVLVVHCDHLDVQLSIVLARA